MEWSRGRKFLEKRYYLSRYSLFLAFTGIPGNFCTICPYFQCLKDSCFQRASELHRGKTLWMLIARFTDEMWMLQ